MKKISAVICELNPAHEGHKYIFSRAKEEGEAVIAVMSGNFVQRGENAIYDKNKRAEAALEIGADLVVELPFPWSSASAEFFASAGVEIAEKLGAECLVFGSECGDKAALCKAAEILKDEQFNSAIPGEERAAEYREKLLREKAPELPSEILSSANDILGVEYIKNAKTAECIPVKRISCHSASAIRENMKIRAADNDDAVFNDKLLDLEYYKLRMAEEPKFTTAESSGGVGERLYKSAAIAENGADMLEKAKTKQYTNARLRRSALYYLTNVEADDLREKPLFTCVLASNEKGRAILSLLRKKTELVILTKPSATEGIDDAVLKQIKKAQAADSIYTLLFKTHENKDYFIKKSPVIK